MQVDEKLISSIVEQVIRNVQGQVKAAGIPDAPGKLGVFTEVDDAMAAAVKAQQELVKLSLDKREELIQAMRRAGIDNAEPMAKFAVEETRLGNVEDKIFKNKNASRQTPGTEDIQPKVYAGDEGMVLVERAPFGVITAICPTTHPVALVINNAIAYVASGNAAFFCPHPRAQKTSLKTMQMLNEAIINAGGPANLLVGVENATLEVVDRAVKHPSVKLIVASGGPAVVKAALTSGKPAVAAGPGNPPVLVDETADLKKAAADIVSGHSFDNNLLCIAEKTVVVIDTVADELIRGMVDSGAYLVKGADIDKLTALCVKDGKVSHDCVGQDATKLLAQIGITAPPTTKCAILEVAPNHPLVQLEQLMPVLPVVRVKTFEQGLELSKQIEHGFGHTAIIHSKDVTRITKYSQVMACTLLVVNKPSGASLRIGAPGQFSHTVAGPTGQGVAVPSTFTRERRVILGNAISRYSIL
jgi:propionaldehyde dehydrogenase